MKELSKSYFYRLISKHHFSKDTMVKDGCIQILEYLLSKDVDVESSFYFEDLRKHIHKDIDNEDFIYSVFFLCRKDMNVLQQEFTVWNNENSSFEHYLDKNHIYEILKSQDFCNPISGESLKATDFENEVLTFFCPTRFFVENKSE